LHEPTFDAEDKDVGLEDALISRRNVEQAARVHGPARAAGDGLVVLGEDVVDRPPPVHEGRRIPSQPFPEGLASVYVARAALAVGHEVRGDEVVYGVQVAAG